MFSMNVLTAIQGWSSHTQKIVQRHGSWNLKCYDIQNVSGNHLTTYMIDITNLPKIFCWNNRYCALILCEDITIFAIYSNRVDLQKMIPKKKIQDKKKGIWSTGYSINFLRMWGHTVYKDPGIWTNRSTTPETGKWNRW